MTRLRFPRPALAAELADRARGGVPLLISGPPGSGKTAALLETAQLLESKGWRTVYLDLMAAASSPDRLVTAALAALPAEGFGEALPRANELRRLVEAGRQTDARAVAALLSLWSGLVEAQGRPVALLLDEVTEVRSLAYFAGLRQIEQSFGRAVSQRRHGTLLATSYPTLAARRWPGFAVLPVPGLAQADIVEAAGSAGWNASELLSATGGSPRYARALLDAAEPGLGLRACWAREMDRGGHLETACRQTWETLLLRSRGYGMSKAVLDAVAREEGLNLTALVARLGRTPGAVGDYLSWLLGVDALRKERKRYYYVDRLLADWVRLFGRGRPASAAELDRAAEAACRRDLRPGTEHQQDTGESLEAEIEAARPARRHDSLMEID